MSFGRVGVMIFVCRIGDFVYNDISILPIKRIQNAFNMNRREFPHPCTDIIEIDPSSSNYAASLSNV